MKTRTREDGESDKHSSGPKGTQRDRTPTSCFSSMMYGILRTYSRNIAGQLLLKAVVPLFVFPLIIGIVGLIQHFFVLTFDHRSPSPPPPSNQIRCEALLVDCAEWGLSPIYQTLCRTKMSTVLLDASLFIVGPDASKFSTPVTLTLSLKS